MTAIATAYDHTSLDNEVPRFQAGSYWMGAFWFSGFPGTAIGFAYDGGDGLPADTRFGSVASPAANYWHNPVGNLGSVTQRIGEVDWNQSLEFVTDAGGGTRLLPYARNPDGSLVSAGSGKVGKLVVFGSACRSWPPDGTADAPAAYLLQQTPAYCWGAIWDASTGHINSSSGALWNQSYIDKGTTPNPFNADRYPVSCGHQAGIVAELAPWSNAPGAGPHVLLYGPVATGAEANAILALIDGHECAPSNLNVVWPSNIDHTDPGYAFTAPEYLSLSTGLELYEIFGHPGMWTHVDFYKFAARLAYRAGLANPDVDPSTGATATGLRQIAHGTSVTQGGYPRMSSYVMHAAGYNFLASNWGISSGDSGDTYTQVESALALAGFWRDRGNTVVFTHHHGYNESFQFSLYTKAITNPHHAVMRYRAAGYPTIGISPTVWNVDDNRETNRLALLQWANGAASPAPTVGAGGFLAARGAAFTPDWTNIRNHFAGWADLGNLPAFGLYDNDSTDSGAQAGTSRALHLAYFAAAASGRVHYSDIGHAAIAAELAPVLKQATAVGSSASVTSSGATLSVTSPSGVGTVVRSWYLCNGDDHYSALQSGATASTLTLTGLSPGTTYTYIHLAVGVLPGSDVSAPRYWYYETPITFTTASASGGAGFPNNLNGGFQ